MLYVHYRGLLRFFYPSTDNSKNHNGRKGGMSNFRVVSRGIKKIVNCRFKSSLELMLCVIDISTLNKTYLIYLKPLSWPMAMALCHWVLMACWQRRGQINHLQVQSVLYFSLYEKTGSWLTLCHPSTNATNIIKLLNISCADVVTSLSCWQHLPKTFSSSHPWGR